MTSKECPKCGAEMEQKHFQGGFPPILRCKPCEYAASGLEKPAEPLSELGGAGDAADTGHEESKHEREMLEVIDQRDRAEAALSEAYFLIIGRSPEWSNLFGYDEALEEIGDAQELLRKSIPQPSPPPDSAAPELPAPLPESGEPRSNWSEFEEAQEFVEDLRNGGEAYCDIATNAVMESIRLKRELASLRERLGVR